MRVTDRACRCTSHHNWRRFTARRAVRANAVVNRVRMVYRDRHRHRDGVVMYW
jgi:hypothetical protein